jgi:hypothetical protein
VLKAEGVVVVVVGQVAWWIGAMIKLEMQFAPLIIGR